MKKLEKKYLEFKYLNVIIQCNFFRILRKIYFLFYYIDKKLPDQAGYVPLLRTKVQIRKSIFGTCFHILNEVTSYDVK